MLNTVNNYEKNRQVSLPAMRTPSFSVAKSIKGKSVGDLCMFRRTLCTVRTVCTFYKINWKLQ